jgi:hypothetical protein
VAKDYRGQYVLTKRTANRRSGQQLFWKDWNDALKQSRRDSKRHRHYWDGDMSELVKRIEKDPYNFLFGRSNEYLQLGKGWSSFYRSFLDPEASSEQERNTSSAQEHSVKSTAADGSPETSTKKADDDVVTVKSYKPSDVNSLRYDPISGRMKPVEQPATEMIRDKTKDDSHTTDIPVKAFTGGVNPDHTEVSEQEFPKLKDTALPAQGPRPQVNKDNVFYMAGPTEDSNVTLKDTSSTPTPGLQQSKVTLNGQKKKLHYELKEVTEDDVDLLRASDIRASFFTGETKQELAEKKKQAREAMEKDYSLATYQNIDDEILQGLRQKKDASLVKDPAIDAETPADTLERLRLKYIPQAENSGSVYKADDSNTNTGDHISIASVTTSALNDSLNETLESTRRFIDDVKVLTNDIQKACEIVEATANTSLDTLRILAFDSASSQVVCGETTSSMHANEPIRHAADVLLQLNKPAKFLPYFAEMKSDGYEIVSGGGDILIFRKTVTSGSENAMTESADIEHLRLSTDGKAGSAADSPSQPSPNTDRSSSRIVNRQETVFTGGPPNWSPYHPPSSSIPPTSVAAPELQYTQTEPSTKSSTASRLGKGLRRIVLSGVATAGTFYAIGVVCEYFLTGGQDGLGPEGFTEFEAERRRRD